MDIIQPFSLCGLLSCGHDCISICLSVGLSVCLRQAD